jgi:Icc-related predicted phosphoesterase
MKILAFIDVHSNPKSIQRLLKKAEGVDIIVGAGDLSDWGEDIKKVLSRFRGVKKPFLVLHGNHESEKAMRKVCSDLKFPIFLHKSVFEFNGYTFVGYGGGGFAYEDTEFDKFYKGLKLKKDSKVVLITHAPPYGTKCDYLPHAGFVGCKSFNRMIKDAKPVLHIFGHIHENASCKDMIGNTVIINPGPDGKIIRI